MPLTIRKAVEDDAQDIATIHVAGWQSSYKGLVDQDYLDNLDVGEKTAKWQKMLREEENFNLLIASCDDTPCGFANYGKLRTPIPGQSPIRPLYTAELYAIYILEDYWRKGIGTKLIQEAVRDLQEQKHRSLSLWVLKKNTRAVAFYEKLGGQRCGKKDTEIGGRTFKENCFGWRDTAKLIG